MHTILLAFYLLTGKVEKVDGLYTLHLDDNTVIEYAYKGEVLHWIDTGEFQYNDFLATPQELR